MKYIIVGILLIGVVCVSADKKPKQCVEHYPKTGCVYDVERNKHQKCSSDDGWGVKEEYYNCPGKEHICHMACYQKFGNVPHCDEIDDSCMRETYTYCSAVECGLGHTYHKYLCPNQPEGTCYKRCCCGCCEGDPPGQCDKCENGADVAKGKRHCPFKYAFD